MFICKTGGVRRSSMNDQQVKDEMRRQKKKQKNDNDSKLIAPTSFCGQENHSPLALKIRTI